MGCRLNRARLRGILSKHNFGASGGRLDIPVKPAVADVIRTSGLLVTTAAPNSRSCSAGSVTTWKPTAELSAEAWTVRG